MLDNKPLILTREGTERGYKISLSLVWFCLLRVGIVFSLILSEWLSLVETIADFFLSDNVVF